MKFWEGKNVFIELKDGRRYTARVDEVERRGDGYWFVITDRFGVRVEFSSELIDLIKEEVEIYRR